jgi:pSer/pThr/pTyr-binding forkhead associated (FHA) protein
MPATLVALSEGPNILLDKPILLLGRHPECDIQIDSRKVSRRHCCIAQVADYLVVRDLGSTNGIRINGIRALEGRLKTGDELTIGSYRYQVRWDVLPAKPSQPRPMAREPLAITPGEDALDDEVLESCDDPVPLVEPNATAPEDASNHGPASGPRAAAKRHPSDQPQKRPDSRILPDQLELAPSRDALPKS